MTLRLIEFWREYQPTNAPYIHPKDKAFVESESEAVPGILREIPEGLHEFSEFPGFGSPALHVSLLPQPYAGNLETADIIVLLINPGLSFSDYWGEQYCKALRSRLQRNLHQDLSGIEFPFLWLDPEFSWHGGFVWWEKRLREVISKIADTSYKGNYVKALKQLSNRIASLELLPYHSHTSGAPKAIMNMPSVLAAKETARSVMLSDAHRNKRTLIVTRGSKEWEVTKEQEKPDQVVVYSGGQARGASLSLNSAGGKAICKVLKASGRLSPAK